MKYTLATLALLITAVGCHAQIPPASTQKVVLTWSAPQAVPNGWQGCTTASPCVYAVYRAITTGSNCPVTGSAQLGEITPPAARPSALTFTDTSASGLDVCYSVETVQGSLNSGPSNTVNLNVPGVPGAPQLGTPVTAMSESIELPPSSTKTLALSAPVLRVR